MYFKTFKVPFEDSHNHVCFEQVTELGLLSPTISLKTTSISLPIHGIQGNKAAFW